MTNYLFVTCFFIGSIWSWLANFNNFEFDYTTVEELWLLDASIPLKDRLLIEMVRGAVLWTVWLARNKLCFQGVFSNPRSIGAQILSLLNFWVTSRNDGSKLKLSLIIPSDISNLPVHLDGLMVQADLEEGGQVAGALISGLSQEFE